MSDSLWPQGLQHSRLLSPTLSPGVGSNSCPLNQWCYLTISSPATPLLFFPSIFPCLRVFFPVSQLLTSGGQSIGASASASVLPMNIQSWFLLGLNGLISLLSKGLSRVFSSTTLQKHQFFCTQPSLWSNFHTCTWLIEKPHLWLYAPLSAKVMSLFYYFV